MFMVPFLGSKANQTEASIWACVFLVGSPLFPSLWVYVGKSNEYVYHSRGVALEVSPQIALAMSTGPPPWPPPTSRWWPPLIKFLQPCPGPHGRRAEVDGVKPICCESLRKISS